MQIKKKLINPMMYLTGGYNHASVKSGVMSLDWIYLKLNTMG